MRDARLPLWEPAPEALGRNNQRVEESMPTIIHVLPLENGWAVEDEGGPSGRILFATQGDAIAAATEKAKLANAELVVHGHDGRIRSQNTTGRPDESGLPQ